VLADRQRFQQVLLNLLSNAVKYNRPGGTVSFTCEEHAQGWRRIKVIDTGYGMAPEDLPKLFTPFERLKATQTRVEGTGIGLALSKRLAEAMGGCMGVESVLDRGSTFWVELPQVDCPAVIAGKSEMDTPTADDDDLSRESWTLLYIEDNLSNLKLIETLLERRPVVKLLSAMQGGMGLDLARRHRPNLILLDLHLPDMLGENVLKWLREYPETRDIPVVILSADATTGQIQRLLEAGAQAYLTKPINLKQFLHVIDEYQPVKSPGGGIAER